jgi:hypothetical protein
MITSWDIYWITRLDSINAFLAICSILSIAIFILVGSTTEGFEDYRNRKKIFVISISSIFLLTMSALLTPTTKEFAVIYLAPKIINNEQVQKIPDNALKLLNKKMEEYINDLDKEKK